MNMLKYQTEDVPRSLSKSFHKEHAHPEYLLGILSTAKALDQLADSFKKALYYGSIPEGGLPFLGHMRARDVIREGAKNLDMGQGNPILLHAALGILTEAVEFFELIYEDFEKGKTLDVDHAREELGDLLWYQAIALNELKSTFEAEAERNIAKLKARYPEKFTEEAAVNRDTDAEQLAMNL